MQNAWHVDKVLPKPVIQNIKALPRPNDTFEHVLIRMTDAFFSVDREWRFTDLNPAAEEAFGCSASVLLGSRMWDFFPNLVGTELEPLYRDVMLGGTTIGYCAPFPPDDHWFDLRLFPSADGLMVYFRDVTRERDTVRRLLASEARFRYLVEQVPAVIYSHQIGIGAPITYMSPYIEEITGYPVASFLADRSLWMSLIHPSDLDTVYAADRHLVDFDAPFKAEYRIITRLGHVRWVADEAISVTDPMTGEMNWQGVLRDITALKDAQDELRQQACHDPLTGLGNRVALDACLAQHLTGTHQGEPVAILFVDLDRFKMINDAYGHDAGDQLLREIARRLETSLDRASVVARFGGDEFVAVIANIGIEDVTRTAEGLIEALRQPIVVGSSDVVIACSIGIAISSPGIDTSELLRCAGLALQRAKVLGRDRVAHFTPSLDLAAEQLALISGLRKALEREELELFYQPVLHCQTGAIVTIEALIRWRHPLRGLVGPDEFLPLIEETSLISVIGDWVVQQACCQLHVWQEQLGCAAPAEVSVNVAARQLFDPGFPARVFRTLADHDLHAHNLRLELSERTEPAALQVALSVLDALVDGGIRLSLDDFGAGNSSLSYFRTVQADDLKLDRIFLGLDAEDGRSQAILTSITSMGHALGLTVTAEGVETTEQLELVRAAGCDRVQGYLTGSPMSVLDLTRWLEESARLVGGVFRRIEWESETETES